MIGAGVGSPAVPRNISEKVSCRQRRELVWYCTVPTLCTELVMHGLVSTYYSRS